MYFAPYMFYYYQACKKDTREEYYEKMKELDKRFASDHLKNILKMQGYYVKSAQILSEYYDLSYDLATKLRILEDQVPPRDFDEVKKIVESEFGKPIHEVYKTFDEKAFAAASIG